MISIASFSASICKGRGSLSHNNREFFTPNVDRERTALNIIYKKEPLEEAYDRIFGGELVRYNETQSRADRKINNYMQHIRMSKNGEKLFYETVVQIGNRYSCGVLTETGEIAGKLLDEYMRGFQSRNPNLYVFNAVLHMDEPGGTPHLHIDYIPVATGYKRGLQVRNSLDKALKQQGIDGVGGKYENSTQNWQKAERTALGEVMKRHGWELAAESGIKREKLTVAQYKATMQEIEARAEKLPTQIESKALPMSKDKVVVSKEALEELELRAKLVIIHEEAHEAVQEKITEKLDEVDTYIEQEKANLQAEVERARREIYREKERVRQQREKAEQEVRIAYYKQEDAKKAIQENPKLHKENEKLKESLKTVKEENASLRAQIEAVKESANKKISEVIENAEAKISALNIKWEKALTRAYTIIRDICKAVGMLKYDNTHGYGVNALTLQQDRLIDAIANYGAKEAKSLGFTEIAEDINKHIGISPAIKNEIKQLMPKDRGER